MTKPISITPYLDKRYYLDNPSYILYVLINYFNDQNNAMNISIIIISTQSYQ